MFIKATFLLIVQPRDKIVKKLFFSLIKLENLFEY